ncbi:hypothetical protein QBC38DRAFT_468665 [Podospora fimiseda]|uniref:FAD/NAD(P)-binding domain-containing protein n=1 Tax=Podospora fimiseda TaxID=252190 RepID=A0AAN7BWJ5_9PEZI|nr:hypothetical protein QBC38DRAFT_468665 [Podospora fimiseda]
MPLFSLAVALRRQQFCRFPANTPGSVHVHSIRRNYHLDRLRRPAAIVVGAGPAGIATVGNLLETIKDGEIVWFDKSFKGGRINSAYREVPGNTAVKLFVDYAKAVEPFREIVESAAKPNPITVLEGLPQDGTCSLSHAGDMLQFLTDGLLKKHPRLKPVIAEVKAVARDTEASLWNVFTDHVGIPKNCPHRPWTAAPLLVYCTGSHPIEGLAVDKPSVKRLPLDTALRPSVLSKLLKQELVKKDGPLKIGVIGGSHSAILVLMNLYAIAKEYPNREIGITWFARSKTLKYAEQRDGYILNDNTGLKGHAAKFAREMLDGEALDNSHAGKYIQRELLTGTKAQQHRQTTMGVTECDLYVEAIGYERERLPPTRNPWTEIVNEEGQLAVNELFNPRTGAIGNVADGLYGAGIAFPEEVDTPEGTKEMAVGMWKFMKYLKRAVPEWVAAAGIEKK